MCVGLCDCMYLCVCVCVTVYSERESERDRQTDRVMFALVLLVCSMAYQHSCVIYNQKHLHNNVSDII